MITYKNATEIGKSAIHGNGIFTMTHLKKGEEIFVVTDMSVYKAGGDYITEQGKMVNHQLKGNCDIVLIGSLYILCANRNIEIGEELTSNYTVAPSIYKRTVEGYKEL